MILPAFGGQRKSSRKLWAAKPQMSERLLLRLETNSQCLPCCCSSLLSGEDKDYNYKAHLCSIISFIVICGRGFQGKRESFGEEKKKNLQTAPRLSPHIMPDQLHVPVHGTTKVYLSMEQRKCTCPWNNKAVPVHGTRKVYLSMEQRRCTCPWNNEGAVRKENCFFLMVMSRGKKTKSTTDKPQTVFIYVCVILPLPQTVQTHLHVNTCSVSIFPSSVLAFCPHQHTC